MPLNRLMVIDSSLNPRISTELARRGRNAIRVSELKLKNALDPDLLRALTKRFDEWVLVTGDDRMPGEHGAVILETKATIATVDPARKSQYNPDQWGRDVVHRWAHAIQEQQLRSVERYSLNAHRKWVARRKKLPAS